MLEYGILYKRYKLNESTFLLVPIKLVDGYCYETIFYHEDKELKEASTIENIKQNKTLVDGILNEDDLMEYYNDVDADFLKDYYFLEESDYVIFISTKDNIIVKKKIPIESLISKSNTEIYEMINDMSVVTLNEDKLDDLLNMEDIDSIKEQLHKFKDKVIRYRDEESKVISKIVVSDGSVSRIETEGKLYFNINSPEYKELSEIRDGFAKFVSYNPGDFSVSGLYNYLKERVIGHDKELKIISTRLIRNLKTKPGNRTKNILVPGPTGTGKTLTFEVASEYLGVPYTFVNTADLVPQGIVGTSIQDVFLSLLDSVDGDDERVRRSIVVFDEFDKLEVSRLDLKQSVKPIFLKLLEGSKIELQTKAGFGLSDQITFDTSLLSKVFLGAFSECFLEEKTLGFNSTREFDKNFSKEKMYKKGYYDRELITRIPIVVPFYELTKDEMREALLCKSSELVKEINELKLEFGIDVVGIEDFIEGVLERLNSKDTSMRDLNNIIINAFNDIEYELEDNPDKYKKLVLKKETSFDSSKFDLY